MGLSKRRGGRFTSSQISRLTTRSRSGESFGKPALTYIDEVVMELKMKDSLDTGFSHGKAVSWGNFMEKRVERLLRKKDVRYGLKSSGFKTHPEEKLAKYWGGSSDFKYVENGKITKISELKSYQKKKFAQYTEALLSKDLELLKKKFKPEYWQIVSNCIIHEVDYGEAITYLPKENEYDEIQEMAYNYDGDDQWKYRFIYEEPMENLPFQPNDSYYDNLNIFKFKIPKEDKEFLNNCVNQSIEKVESIIENTK